jgi:hypothetical protein
MTSFKYKFDELPLVIANGVEGALTNGEAEIEFERDGTWMVSHIAVEGYRNATKEEIAKGSRPFIRDLAPLPAGNELDFLISQRLEGEWRDRVQDAVREQIEALHAEAA